MSTTAQHPEKRTYVTLLSDESYLKGVLTLHYSLMQTYPAYPLLVLLNDTLPAKIQQILTQAKIPHKVVPRLHYTEHNKQTMNSRGWNSLLNNTADKLSVLALTEYDKVVYLDADMLVLKNIDYLFRYPHGSAVIDAGNIMELTMNGQYNDAQYAYAHQFNSGLFVFQPNQDDYQYCLTLLQTEVGFDQEILRLLWSDWIHTPQRHIPQTCNILPPTSPPTSNSVCVALPMWKCCTMCISPSLGTKQISTSTLPTILSILSTANICKKP